MDIVSRLKTFINYLNIPVTQFADTCSIPRPTLSQLLNGRNKKVSDELIGKIHDSFPQLSVLWLMFGEGNMLHEQNIETSEGKSGSIFDFPNDKGSNNERITPSIDFEEKTSDLTSEKFENSTLPSNINNQLSESIKSHEMASDKEMSTQISDKSSTISFQTDQTKKIVNIIVYYNDNSFESFVPNTSGKN